MRYTIRMNDPLLDLHDRPRIVDFLADAAPYASKKDRDAADALVRAYMAEEKIRTDVLARGARELAEVTWPARHALRAFFNGDGAPEEWKLVLAVVRPSTAHLLKRLREPGLTLDQALASDDADMAIKDAEEMEIDAVRKQVREAYWRDHANALQVFVEEGKREWQAYEERLKQLRELALALPRGMQDEAFNKCTRYEERVLFGNEMIPLELLDEEVAFAKEQAAIDPFAKEVKKTKRIKRRKLEDTE